MGEDRGLEGEGGEGAYTTDEERDMGRKDSEIPPIRSGV